MANIRVDVQETIKNGYEVIFLSPCDCSDIQGLAVYHPNSEGTIVSSEFSFKDAHGNDLSDLDNLFTKDVYVKVILSVTDKVAYIQNADTNKYLEGRFDHTVTKQISMNRKSNSAVGDSSTSLGSGCEASGDYSVAEGFGTKASGLKAHSEGNYTNATGESSHAEGDSSVASGRFSHAEGSGSRASGGASHAEGASTASNEFSHSEGRATASGQSSHAEGDYTNARSNCSHSEGLRTTASNNNAHAEGDSTNATGESSHSEGRATRATARASHAEGDSTIAGDNTATISDDISPLDVYESSVPGASAHAEGIGSIAKKSASHAEGFKTQASEVATHAEGIHTIASGKGAHAEGENTKAEGDYSHAEGGGCWAYREYCHAEGCNDGEQPTTASCKGAHAEGIGTISSGNGSHSEGKRTQALREASHAEGRYTKVEGDCGHAEGEDTYVGGYASHAEGGGTKASSQYQHVQGKFNVEDTANKYAHIVGGGTSNNARKNIHTIDWNGNAEFAGDVKAKDEKGNEISLVDFKKSMSNVPNVSTNDQTPTYTVTSTLGELVSGEKLSVAFGKISKAIKDLIALKTTVSNHSDNKSNPHSVTASQVGLGNVPNVTTNNQTPTFTTATSLAELTSGEKLSTSLGKISKAIKDLISHIGNKSNPHSVNCTQLGAVSSTTIKEIKYVTSLPSDASSHPDILYVIPEK